MTDVLTTNGMPTSGWYDDPGGSAQLRWWDGSAWTDYLQDRPVAYVPTPEPVVEQAIEPLPEPAPTPAPVAYDFAEFVPAIASSPGYLPPVTRAEMQEIYVSGSGGTVAVWMLAIFPLIATGLQFIALDNLGRLDILVAIYAIIVVSLIVLAIADRVSLARKNIGGPTLWWLLLAFPFSYLIARAVKLGRLGIPSTAPLVVYIIAGVVAGGVLGGVIAPMQLAKFAQTQAVAQTEALETQIATKWTEATGLPADVVCPEDVTLGIAGTTFECVVEGASPTTIYGKVTEPYTFEIADNEAALN